MTSLILERLAEQATHTMLFGRSAYFGQQSALAYARRAFDQENPAAAVRHRCNQRVDHLQFFGPSADG